MTTTATMTEHIDTREGWREIAPGSPLRDEQDVLTLDTQDGKRSWVREAPVPPLPTEQYTVIRVTWNDGPRSTDELALIGGLWGDFPANNVSRNIVAWELLAEPRAVTAKAVLDRLTELLEPNSVVTGGIYRTLAREFGVEND